MGNRKRRMFVIGIAVLLVLGTLLGAYVADTRARRTAVERAESVLLDSAHEQAEAFTATLIGRFQVLKGLSSALSAVGETTRDETERLLETVRTDAELSFAALNLIYADGIETGVGTEEGLLSVADRDYFIKAMSGERAMEYAIGRRSGRACVILAVPYCRDGEVCGILRGLYYEEEMRRLLTAEVYGGQSHSVLIDSAGRIIVNAEKESELINDTSLFDTLAKASFQEDGALEALRAALPEGRGGTLRYTRDGKPSIAVIMPLESELLPENDWFVVNIVREDSLAREVAAGRRNSMEAIAVVATFAIIALLILMQLEHNFRKEASREAELTRQREEQFRIVTEQSGKGVMRYDIPTKTASLSNTSDGGFGDGNRYGDAAETAISRGYVDPSSAEDYRTFFKKVDAGESPVSVDILMRRPDGSVRWYKHTATTIFDAAGKPQSAIISYFDDTEQRERELAYMKWQQELDDLSYEDASLYEWNLTKSTYERHRGRLATEDERIAEEGFDEHTRLYMKHHVLEEDRAAFFNMMSREHLLARYVGGEYGNSMDYRFVADDGTVSWRQISVQLVPYPNNQDIKAYVTNRDIDAEKRQELALVNRSQQDFLTGALNRETFMDRVNGILAHSPASTHTLLMLDMDGFKQVNDVLGHDVGDKTLSELVGSIRAVLRASDVVGRIGGDEFMVFLPDMPFDAAIGRKAAQLCLALRRRLSEQIRISVSIGIAVYPRDGADFEALYRCADTALYYAKNQGKDSYAFYRKGMSVEGAAESAKKLPALVETPLRRALIAVTEDDGFFDELSAMLAPDYETIRADADVDPAALYSDGYEVYAAIFDADSDAGREALRFDGARWAERGLTLLAATEQRSVEGYVQLVKDGAEFAIPKPVSREYLLLRLDRLYAMRNREKLRMQSAYQRIQTSEEMRYREVLNATGTTVFVFDLATRTYQVDLQSEPVTAGEYDGHSLGAELIQKGIASEEDVMRIQAAMNAVERGETPRARLTVQLKTKDGPKRWYRVQVVPMRHADVLTPKLLILANDANEQVEGARIDGGAVRQ